MAYPRKREGVRGPYDYTLLTPFIHEVNQEIIRVNRDTKKRSVNFMNKVVEYVVKKLKDVNKPFTDMYKDTRRIGSFFDGTKVKTSPSEFDVYIVLQFPSQKPIEVKRDDEDPGFVKVQKAAGMGSMMMVEESSVRWENLGKKKTLKRMVDENGYIRRDQVLNWWKSIFTQAMHTSNHVTKIDGQNCSLRWFNSESGIKVHVTNPEGETEDMDIDMIPVLRFNDKPTQDPHSTFLKFNSWVETMNLQGMNVTRDWYVFPKPLKHNDTDHDDLLWGLSFTDQEKQIIHNKQHLKPAIRLLKRLRDNYAWKPLTSYCIKTIFLHSAHREELHQRDLGYLLVWYLSKLEENLQCQELPFFWVADKNLFDGIKFETLENIRGFVNRRLKTIHRLLDENDAAGLRSQVRKLFIDGIEEDEDSSTAVALYGGATDPGYGSGSPFGSPWCGSGSGDCDGQGLLGWGKPAQMEEGMSGWDMASNMMKCIGVANDLGYAHQLLSRPGTRPSQKEDEGMSGWQKALLIGGGAAVVGGAAMGLMRTAVPGTGSGSGAESGGASTSSGRSLREHESRIDSWGNRVHEERQEEEEKMSDAEKALLVGGGAALLGGLAMFFQGRR